MSGEITGLRLATIHSLYFYLDLMKQMKSAILEGGFSDWKKEFEANYQEDNNL